MPNLTYPTNGVEPFDAKYEERLRTHYRYVRRRSLRAPMSNTLG